MISHNLEYSAHCIEQCETPAANHLQGSTWHGREGGWILETLPISFRNFGITYTVKAHLEEIPRYS